MKLLRGLRNLLAGPPRISDPDLGEVDADLSEEVPDAAEDVAELERAESSQRLRDEFRPNIASFEDAETAHGNNESQEAPPDPTP